MADDPPDAPRRPTLEPLKYETPIPRQFEKELRDDTTVQTIVTVLLVLVVVLMALISIGLVAAAIG